MRQHRDQDTSPTVLINRQAFHTAMTSAAAGSPEAVGKADYLSTLITQITSGLGATVGLAQVIARAMNVRARRLEALHDVSHSAVAFFLRVL